MNHSSDNFQRQNRNQISPIVEMTRGLNLLQNSLLRYCIFIAKRLNMNKINEIWGFLKN